MFSPSVSTSFSPSQGLGALALHAVTAAAERASQAGQAAAAAGVCDTSLSAYVDVCARMCACVFQGPQRVRPASPHCTVGNKCWQHCHTLAALCCAPAAQLCAAVKLCCNLLLCCGWFTLPCFYEADALTAAVCSTCLTLFSSWAYAHARMAL